MAKRKRKPQVLAMILCDQIIRDEASKKLTLVGCFDRIVAPEFPTSHGSLALYVALTDGEGTYEGEFRISLAGVRRVLLSSKGQFTLDHPLEIAEINFPIRRLQLPEPGEYEFQFLCDGERLIGRRIIAEQQEGEEE